MGEMFAGAVIQLLKVAPTESLSHLLESSQEKS
jgi:hypothetical protein